MAGKAEASKLDLSSLPPIYILPTHLQTDELHEAEEALYHAGGSLTYSATEARIFLGRIGQKKRAAFDLRSRGVWTEETSTDDGERPRKRVKTESSVPAVDGGSDAAVDPAAARNSDAGRILVLKMDWLDRCRKEDRLIPYDSYIVYSGRAIPKPADETSPKPLTDASLYIKADPEPSDAQPSSPSSKEDAVNSILSRAQADAPAHATGSAPFHRRRFAKPGSTRTSTSPTLTHALRPPKLYRTTTSEFENLDPESLPPAPDWVTRHQMYACLRSTPLHTTNAAFIAQLSKIKEARVLTLDEIGVRAYSSAIASLSAYPHLIRSPQEILRLPGCEQKIAMLWSEWNESGPTDAERFIQAVRDLESNQDLHHLKIFYEIWGVGADTARRFYFGNGWKDIDDVVEFGWASLSRVQQIGVKYYDDFQRRIPRQEVKNISAVILQHARTCKGIPKTDWDGGENDMVLVIVGGYRRGKTESGDVDVIVSHRDPSKTRDLVIDVVASLEAAGWITHTLTLNTTTSDRGQQTLPYRGDGHGGHGFDSLDKALCVWQDPHFDDQGGTITKNPNVHRRVDIIISAWKTVGCAVLGWSGGTTFQRDIRRWVKRERGWKFDSSGVRDRSNGLVLELEAPKTAEEPDSWLDREKRLMEGLGIGWRPAEERCTG